MTTQPTSLSDLLAVLYKEGKRRLFLLSSLFTVVALAALGVSLMMPKKYDASTLILVEANSVVKPLMEGHGLAATNIADQTAVVNQIVLGKKILREMLIFGGWVPAPPARQPDPREAERLLTRLRSRIKIDSKDDFIRISFTDNDPKRTYVVANKLAEIYLRESMAGKERESREAFEFIDKQVKEYGDKLADIHQKVLAQYRGSMTPAPAPSGSDEKPAPTARPPANKISDEELAALRAEEALLERQIARKGTPIVPKTDGHSEEQARYRVTQLQNELDKLSVTLTDEHPDVKRVKRELAGAREELKRAEEATAAREAARDAASQLDDDVARAAKARLEDVQRRIAAATGKPVVHHPGTVAQHRPITTDPNDEMRGVGRDTALSELLRRYEATRDVYQDLLKRRENARVAMELDVQHRGFNLMVQEPAEMPVAASGLRLMHLSLIGIILALAVPLGILFLIVQLDRRVRSPLQVERMARVPLLGTISDSRTRRESNRFRMRGVLAASMVIGVFVVYAAAFLIKLKTSS